MFPSFSIHNITNSNRADTKKRGYINIAKSLLREFADSYNIIYNKFRVSIIRSNTASVSASGNSILNIIIVISQKKMLWIDTDSIITGMSNNLRKGFIFFVRNIHRLHNCAPMNFVSFTKKCTMYIPFTSRLDMPYFKTIAIYDSLTKMIRNKFTKITGSFSSFHNNLLNYIISQNKHESKAVI